MKNTDEWWLTVKWSLGKGGDTAYPALNINNQQVTDSKDKPKQFNEFFLSHFNIDETNVQLLDYEDFPQTLITYMQQTKVMILSNALFHLTQLGLVA